MTLMEYSCMWGIGILLLALVITTTVCVANWKEKRDKKRKETERAVDGWDAAQEICPEFKLYLRREDIATCDGCGCLTLRQPLLKQPSTIFVQQYGPNGEFSRETIVEHYLCLRCQDQLLPPKKAC